MQTFTPNWLLSVQHDGSSNFVSNLYPSINDSVTICIQMSSKAPVTRVILRTLPDGEQSFTEMTRKMKDSWAFWETSILVTEPRVNYRFLLLSKDGHYIFNTQGFCQYEPLDLFDFKILTDYQSPQWVKQSVFYQINPDTWKNERPDLNPNSNDFFYEGNHPQLKPWGEPLRKGESYSQSYYGGDLYGVGTSLPYLKELGINALYLNPIFKAYTTHRYDTVDYDQVDPYLGGNEAWKELNQNLQNNGIRYILDIVPNHCGKRHPWFIKAQSDSQSPEVDFFHFNHYPDTYHCWGGFTNLVKFNFANPELRRRIYRNPDSVFRKWHRAPYHLDGWRVDVGNMLGRDGKTQVNLEVLREIRQVVKEENPEAYFMGENFQDATEQLQGDIWDGIMNYAGFFTPFMNWLNGYSQGALGFHDSIKSSQPFTTEALVQTWKERMGVVPWVINLQQFNMLGSHDTTRVTSIFKGKKALYYLALGYQMTFPGTVCIFYGNEIGMENPGEKSGLHGGSRTCMDWDSSHWNMESLTLYKTLIHLRKNRKALIEGGFQLLDYDREGFIYQRKSGEDMVLFSTNRSKNPLELKAIDAVQAGWKNGQKFREFGGDRIIQVIEGYLEVPEQRQGGIIWLSEQE